MCRNSVQLPCPPFGHGGFKQIKRCINFLFLKTARLEIPKVPISNRRAWLVKPIRKIIRTPSQLVTEMGDTCGYAIVRHHTPGRLKALFRACEISSDGAGALTIPCPTTFGSSSFERFRNGGM